MTGGILWGLSGTCGQYLLQVKGLTSDWLVPLRLFLSGSILLAVCTVLEGKRSFRIWKDRKDARDILIFGIIGMSMCQYTYFMAIGHSNAGTATVLQYIGPVLIMVYVSVQAFRVPGRMEILAVFLALFGTFLLATHGDLRSLSISKEALFWGLLSAVALAVYTTQPGRLLDKWGAMVTTAWGMLIGGVLLSVLFRPWQIAVTADWGILAGMAAIVLFGTVIAFACYLEGVRCAGPQKGSLYAAVEPVSATLFSVLLMNADFGILDLAGFICIISTIFLLASGKK